MKKINLMLIITIISLFVTPASWAISIYFDPAAQDVLLGDSVFVDINVSELNNASTPSLGIFDFDVSFDPSILGFSAVTFGDPVLGDQLDLSGWGAFYNSIEYTGALNLFGLSLDLDIILDTLQADSFTLATAEFQTLALGTSLLSTSINYLGDSSGDPLNAETLSGSINVTSAPVPEPASIFMLGVGLAGLAGVTRKKRIKS